MYNPFGGNRFPYTNFQELNLDWIIEIAKNFLDQYTHIQETIETGLEDLEAKKTELEGLLQAWYDEHSQDIADQLADALQDLNAWYTLHEGYLDQALTDNEAAFDAHAEAKATETLASIPDDYTAVANGVTAITAQYIADKHPADNILANLVPISGGYYDTTGELVEGASYGYTAPIPCLPNTLYSINISNSQYFNFLDENQDFISGSAATYAVSPATAAYIRISGYLFRFPEMVLTSKRMYKNKLDDLAANKFYLAQDVKVTDNTAEWQNLNVDWDFSQPAYVVINNNGENAQVIDVAITQNGTLKQVYHPTVPAYGSYEVTLYDANTAGVHDWMGTNMYFTDYTWGVSIANAAGVKYISASVYVKPEESPLHPEMPFENCILVNPAGIAAFKDISDAIAYAKSEFTVSTTPVTIFIQRGIYNLLPVETREAVIKKGANMISLVGEDRDTTAIILTSTPAHNNKVIEHGGPSRIANLTIKNVLNNDGSSFVYTNNSYCIHNDLAFVSDTLYDTVIDNCYIYSELFAPIGAGLHKNQKQVYRNCTIVFNCKDSNSSTGYNQWAPIYIHTPGTANDESDCSVDIDGCNCYALSGTYAIALPFGPAGSGSSTYATIPIIIQRTIGTTTGSTITDVGSSHDIQPQSALNNVEAWNY